MIDKQIWENDTEKNWLGRIGSVKLFLGTLPCECRIKKKKTVWKQKCLGKFDFRNIQLGKTVWEKCPEYLKMDILFD